MAEDFASRESIRSTSVLSIKILTIRFDLFFGPWQKRQGHARPVIFYARKEIIIPRSPAPRLLHAWEAGRTFQPDLPAGPALSGCRDQAVGGKHSPATSPLRCIFLGSLWASQTESIRLGIGGFVYSLTRPSNIPK